MPSTIIGAPQEKRSTHDLSAPHFTTTDLFKIQPVFAREVFKGDHFNIKTAQINRVDNLPVSSFVEINNRHDWFYVKFNQIWKPFDAFISGTPYAFNYLNNVPTTTPFLTLQELFAFFTGKHYTDTPNSGGEVIEFRLATGIFADPDSSEMSSHVLRGSSINLTNIQAYKKLLDDNVIDFIYVGNSYDFLGESTSVPIIAAIKLNAVGRYIYSIFYSLGYRFPRIYVDTTGHTSANITLIHDNLGLDNVSELADPDLSCSLLPLMAYLSVILNYYVPTKFRDYVFVNSMAYLVAPNLHPDVTQNIFSGLEYSRWRGEIINLMLSLYYGSDYFTDSLIQPFGDLGRVKFSDPAEGLNIFDQGAKVGQYSGLSGYAPYIINGDNRVDPTDPLSGVNGSTEYILAALKAVSTKAQIRALTQNNLLGSMLQQFGVKPESADMIPYSLSTHMDSIIVEPEVASAATELAPLGYKAGNGHGSARFEDDFDFDTYGILLCINSISPKISMSDGLNREMLHTKKEDFFDPQYVNLGYQAIGNIELTANADNTDTDDPFYLAGTFGFQNKFAEYGYPKFSMGGDFCINSVKSGLDAFHFNRILDGKLPRFLRNDKIFAQAKQSLIGAADVVRFESQYDRIFDVDDPNYDHIQQWTYFKVIANRSIAKNGEFTIGDENQNTIEGKSVTDNVNA